MKFFKKLAVLCMALTLCFGVGSTFAACGDDKGSTSSSVQETIAYKFKITTANDEPAGGYRVLLCDSTGTCGMFQVADENGVVEYPASALPGSKTAAAYDIHVMPPDINDSTYLDHTGLKKTPAEFGGAEIILKLK